VLRDLAHRLKGTGGTVGFAPFTEPAGRLQDAAARQDTRLIPELLKELHEISQAIHLPADQPAEPSLLVSAHD
jgi:HPt (histidine-containing phosphotransfer) domain-containing protein